MSNTPHVTLCRGGLRLSGKDDVLPLYAGAMHYWRHSPDEWARGLDEMKAMGMRLVDTYVPWGVHETRQGHFDFGEHFARLDVARFVEMVGERGMYLILRPGPHINAELTYFGVPERIVWTAECQARSPKGNPVILPIVPVAFPVPSYASDAFHDETALWFEAVGKELAKYKYPNGPIVLLQVDNEGALYFRDGPYDQDYHPDAVHAFRQFLRAKYPRVAALRSAWQDRTLTFATVEPPRRFDAETADELAPHLDWMEFHEELLASAMGRFASALETAGFDGLPTFHNFPLAESSTPLNSGRFADVVDLVALDYYHAASPSSHATILRRTTELAARCQGQDLPAFGAEVGAGFPPFFAPLDEADSLYTLLAALAYGLRGFNLYMAVDRDRWVGAPIDPMGYPRRLADDYNALCEALEAVSFHELTRRVPVRLLVPRALRRLARAMHAFGPVTPAVFAVAGAGPTESCYEDDFGLAEVSPPLAGDSFLRAFERALLVRGVPFAYAGGESLDAGTAGASWVVCATASGVKPAFMASLRRLAKAGVRVTVGPRVPERDGGMRPLGKPHDVEGLEVELGADPARTDALVARAIEELGLPTFAVDPADVHVTLHEDRTGAPKVAFVMNPTKERVVATVALGEGVGALRDLLGRVRDRGRIVAVDGAFTIELPPRTVRMFGVDAP